jgi:glutathione S-transferase
MPASPPFLLYGAERSYFTGKVRPALRAKRVRFEEILPTHEVYQDIRRRTGLAFIPVVVTPEDDTWQDTSEIIDALEARVPEPPLVPTTPVQRVVAFLLELYADEFMILPAMHYRWSTAESRQDARDAFVAMSGDAERASRFADRMAGSIEALGVSAATAPAIEAHLAELLAHLERVLADQPFLLGRQPSLADCALMGPLYAHLYLDRVPGALLRASAPRVAHWIERMNHPAVRAFAGFLPDDALHPALHDVLGLVGRDAVPLLLDTVRAVETWADEHARPGETPPRVLGFHETTLRTVPMPRYTSAYALWMVQRPLDAYAALDDAARRRVDAALAGTGCEALLAYRPRHRFAKRAFQLIVAD